jgi:acyl-CoA reductase-like NAD-dependent aldehyde dehydrogenase
MSIDDNKQLLKILAGAFEQRKNDIAEVNYLDTGTSVVTNLENLYRGLATITSYISTVDTVKPSGGMALYSCYNDPSFGLLGMNLAPAILKCGNTNPIVVGFPSILKNYAKLFEEIVKSTGLFSNISFTTGTKDFFGAAINISEIDTAVVFGEQWIYKYAQEWSKLKRAMIFYGPGNNASIILKDADIKTAVKKTLEASFILSGQAAVCINRCYIDNRIPKKEIKQLFTDELAKISFGFDKKSYVTPLKIKMLADLTDRRVKKSINSGAETFQYKIEEKDNKVLVSPSIVWEKTPETELLKEYHFAPVLPVCFVDIDKIAEKTNNTNYGLYASVWGNITGVAKLEKQISNQHIMVLNNQSILDVITPRKGYTGFWGGYKNSGFYFNKNTGWQYREGKIDVLNF